MVKLKQWYARNRPAFPAVGLYLAFAVAIIGAALWLMFGEDLDTLTVVREFDPPGTLKTETRTTEHQLPIQVLAGVLAFGGVLVIPLKFFWDELSNRAESRREYNARMRTLLHSYLEKYYMPTATALYGVGASSRDLSEHCANIQSSAAVLDRWLYPASRYWLVMREMKRGGGSWIFKSHRGEDQVWDTDRKLQKALRQGKSYWGS